MATLVWTYTDLITLPGDSIDVEAIDEIQSNIELLNDDIEDIQTDITALQGAVDTSVIVQRGSSTWNGSAGREITFSTQQTSTVYFVEWICTENPNGNLGEVWISNKTVDGFTIHCSGEADTTFDWKVS